MKLLQPDDIKVNEYVVKCKTELADNSFEGKPLKVLAVDLPYLVLETPSGYVFTLNIGDHILRKPSIQFVEAYLNGSR